MKPGNLFARCFPSLTDFAFLAPAVLLFCIMSGAAGLLGDGDTGWHIRAGDWILDHHRLPTADFFSFTKPGQPWFAWEWLCEVSFAGIHRVAGMAGVILVSVLVLSVTSLLLFRLIRRRSRNSLVACALLAVAVLGMSLHFLARPHLFSFLFAAILLNLLEQRREAGRDVPWIAIPLFVLWANVHPAFAAGLVILAAYTAGELVNALTVSNPALRPEFLARFRRYVLLTAACALAPLANPYGYRLYLHMYSFLSDSYALHHVGEYMVVDFRTPPGRMFEAMILLGALAAFSRLRKRDFAVPFLFVAWVHLALTAQRNVPFFMMVMAAPVALWLEEALGALSQLRSSVQDAKRGAAASERPLRPFPLLSIVAFAAILMLLRAPGSPPKFHPQYDPSVYPAAALPAVRQLGTSARLATTDLWGGYLIYRLYPEVRVFWDGRVDFYGTQYNQAAVDMFMGGCDWSRTLAEHRITAVLVPVNLPLASLLSQSVDWQPVYRDGMAILFQLAPAETSTVAKPRLSPPARGAN